MKNIFALVLCISLFTVNASAQKTKTRSNDLRLLSIRTDYFTNGTFIPGDSVIYTYSGNRGGGGYLYKGETHQLFDSKQSFTLTDGVWKPYARSANTYDANNNLLTYTHESYDGTNWVDGQKEEHIRFSQHSFEDVLTRYVGSGNFWIGQSKQLCTFNAQGDVTEELVQCFDTATNTWVNGYKWNSQYDGDRRITEQIRSFWKNGAWVNNIKTTWKYDFQGNTIIWKEQNWDGAKWIDRSTIASTYNDKRKLLTQLHGDQIAVTNPNTGRVEYHTTMDSTINTYDALGRTTTTRIVHLDKEWHNKSLILNTYLPNNGGGVSLTFNENETTNLWDSSRREFSYNDKQGRRRGDSTQYFLGPNQWVTTLFDSVSLDHDGHLLVDFTKQHEAAGVPPKYNLPYQYNLMTYLPSGQLKTFEACKVEGGVESPWYITNYNYEEYEAPANIEKPSAKIATRAYPNPFTREFTVEFNSDKPQPVTLLLYDITGKLLTRTESSAGIGTNRIEWDDTMKLASGVYTYELIAGNTIGSGKMVVE